MTSARTPYSGCQNRNDVRFPLPLIRVFIMIWIWFRQTRYSARVDFRQTVRSILRNDLFLFLLSIIRSKRFVLLTVYVQKTGQANTFSSLPLCLPPPSPKDRPLNPKDPTTHRHTYPHPLSPFETFSWWRVSASVVSFRATSYDRQRSGNNTHRWPARSFREGEGSSLSRLPETGASHTSRVRWMFNGRGTH